MNIWPAGRLLGFLLILIIFKTAGACDPLWLHWYHQKPTSGLFERYIWKSGILHNLIEICTMHQLQYTSIGLLVMLITRSWAWLSFLRQVNLYQTMMNLCAIFLLSPMHWHMERLAPCLSQTSKNCPRRKLLKILEQDRSRSILAFKNEEGLLSCIYGMSNFFGWWYV